MPLSRESSMKSAPGIAFDYRASRAIAIAGAFVLCAAAIVPWFSALSPAAAASVTIVVLCCGLVSLRRFARPRFRRIAWQASGWRLVDRDGTERNALLASHVHLGSFVSLDFRLDRRARFRALIAPDNVDAEMRRRLILLLSRGEIAQAT